MEKIIVRNKILQPGHINSAYIDLCEGENYDSLQQLLLVYRKEDVIKKIYNEDIMNVTLEDTELFKHYELAISSDKDNDYFKMMYKIEDSFAVHISNNIFLHHIPTGKNDIYSEITPWYYADSAKYIGDAWWEEDKEIIDNLWKLPVLAFLKQYKGYYGW